MKLLAIDAGNTRLKWAIRKGDAWAAQGSLATADAKKLSHLLAAWKDAAFERAIVSNVAGPSVRDAIESALAQRNVGATFIASEAERCGMRNRYAQPSQLGTDRFAALVGAHKMCMQNPVHQIVAMAGTALTIDALTKDGEFIGGVIVPGPTLMRQSLNHGTAQLPADTGRHELFPRNTANAIATGAIDAAVGAIARMHNRLAQHAGVPPREVRLIASGGAMSALVPHLLDFAFNMTINDNLVLDGLAALWNGAR
jgi:type III pantothenate kinase